MILSVWIAGFVLIHSGFTCAEFVELKPLAPNDGNLTLFSNGTSITCFDDELCSISQPGEDNDGLITGSVLTAADNRITLTNCLPVTTPLSQVLEYELRASAGSSQNNLTIDRDTVQCSSGTGSQECILRFGVPTITVDNCGIDNTVYSACPPGRNCSLSVDVRRFYSEPAERPPARLDLSIQDNEGNICSLERSFAQRGTLESSPDEIACDLSSIRSLALTISLNSNMAVSIRRIRVIEIPDLVNESEPAAPIEASESGNIPANTNLPANLENREDNNSGNNQANWIDDKYMFLLIIPAAGALVFIGLCGVRFLRFRKKQRMKTEQGTERPEHAIPTDRRRTHYDSELSINQDEFATAEEVTDTADTDTISPHEV